jgi:hypothetical protein
MARAFLPRSVSYSGDAVDLGWIQIGRVVLLDDDELHISDQVAVVVSRPYSDSDRADIGLLVVEDPERDP